MREPSALPGLLADTIDKLTPLHEAEAAAVRGGPEAGKLIVRLFQTLLEAELLALGLEDEAEFLADELEELREEEAAPARPRNVKQEEEAQ